MHVFFCKDPEYMERNSYGVEFRIDPYNGNIIGHCSEYIMTWLNFMDAVENRPIHYLEAENYLKEKRIVPATLKQIQDAQLAKFIDGFYELESDNKVLTTREHVERNAKDNLSKDKHGIFRYVVNVDVTQHVENAWTIAKNDKIVPTRTKNGFLCYDIPVKNSGIMGGQEGAKQKEPIILNHVRIINRGDLNTVVTAYPIL